MRRRDFLGILGYAVAWPVALKAQSTDQIRIVGMLTILGPDDPEEKARVAVLEQALQQLGWSPGRNLKIEVREVGRDVERLRIPLRIDGLYAGFFITIIFLCTYHRR